MNKAFFIPIATSEPTVEPHDEEVELTTITAEAQVVEDVKDVELAVTVVASTYVEGQPYTLSRALPCRGGRSIDVLETPAELHVSAPAFLKVQGHIEIPESLQSNNSDYGHTTTIKRKWGDWPQDCCLVMFAILWNGFILITFDALGWGALFIPHTWIGIYLVYHIVCLLFNSTVTTITSSTVNVRATPFSVCHRSKSYALDDETVKEIRCKREVTQEGKTVSYEVHIVREDGSSDRVLVGLEYVEEALFVAQEIERMMSIRDNEKTNVV